MEAIVCKILTSKLVVLNVGKNQNVTEGDEFEIFELGDEINDPVTKEPLGKLEIIKGTVVIISVQEKICTAKTKTRKYERTEYESPYAGLLSSYYPKRKTYEYEKEEEMKVDTTDKNYNNLLTVKVGDHARKVG